MTDTYTHAFFSDLMDPRGHKGQFVPISQVFETMDATHTRPTKLIANGDRAGIRLVRPQDGGQTWWDVQGVHPWVMRIRGVRGHRKIELGSASPFIAIEEGKV